MSRDRMIQLTNHSGSQIWINPKYIKTIERAEGGKDTFHSYVTFADENMLWIKQTPEEIVKWIND